VTNPKVQNGAILKSQDTVTTDKLADNAVTTAKIKDGIFLSSLIKSPIGGECNFSRIDLVI
jgi:hypothetical protein